MKNSYLDMARAALARKLIDSKGEVVAELCSTVVEPAVEPPARNPPFTRRVQRVESCHRLTGNGFKPIVPTIPPTAIWATPAVLCPCCRLSSVLPELRGMTGERCYGCWLKVNAVEARGDARQGVDDAVVEQAAERVERS